jgi:hypothetical protein
MERLRIVERELRAFKVDRLTDREITYEEIEALAKLREALALISEVRFLIDKADHKSLAQFWKDVAIELRTS